MSKRKKKEPKVPQNGTRYVVKVKGSKKYFVVEESRIGKYLCIPKNISVLKFDSIRYKKTFWMPLSPREEEFRKARSLKDFVKKAYSLNSFATFLKSNARDVKQWREKDFNNPDYDIVHIVFFEKTDPNKFSLLSRSNENYTEYYIINEDEILHDEEILERFPAKEFISQYNVKEDKHYYYEVEEKIRIETTPLTYEYVFAPYNYYRLNDLVLRVYRLSGILDGKWRQNKRFLEKLEGGVL